MEGPAGGLRAGKRGPAPRAAADPVQVLSGVSACLTNLYVLRNREGVQQRPPRPRCFQELDFCTIYGFAVLNAPILPEQA